MITRTCKQKAVYWGSPTEDGFGGKTFADPVEIACRWEDMQQIVTDAKGNEITSRALVFVLQDVDEEGMLYLGTLAALDIILDELLTADNVDITADNETITADASIAPLPNPMTIEGAYIIKRFQKTPALRNTTEFLRKAYLTPSLSFGGF